MAARKRWKEAVPSRTSRLHSIHRRKGFTQRRVSSSNAAMRAGCSTVMHRSGFRYEFCNKPSMGVIHTCYSQRR
jgi:hypothetical protein